MVDFTSRPDLGRCRGAERAVCVERERERHAYAPSFFLSSHILGERMVL